MRVRVDERNLVLVEVVYPAIAVGVDGNGSRPDNATEWLQTIRPHAYGG
jgi:hypothetical protein